MLPWLDTVTSLKATTNWSMEEIGNIFGATKDNKEYNCKVKEIYVIDHLGGPARGRRPRDVVETEKKIFLH